jgi:hypothetical protein
VGVPLSLHRHILILYPLFSLAQEAQNIRRVANLKAKSFCRNRSLQAGSPSNFLKQQKLSKKEMPNTHYGVAVGATTPAVREFSRLARRDQRSARWMGGRFLKKRRKTKACFGVIDNSLFI